MKKQEEYALTLNGNAKLGSLLIEEAVKKNRERLQNVVVTTVGQLLEQEQVLSKAAAMCRKQIEALEKGQFTVNSSGQLEFNSAELGGETKWLTTCQQCGYRKMVSLSVK